MPRLGVCVLLAVALVAPLGHSEPALTYRIDHVVDGDTIALGNGRRTLPVRALQSVGGTGLPTPLVAMSEGGRF